MTYQPPYQPPQPGFPNFDYYQPDFLAPARRAAGLMFVLGALAIVGSFCCAGTGVMVNQMMQRPEFAAEMQKVPGATTENMRLVMFVAGAASCAFGIVYIVLGVLVRRGNKPAGIVALVLTILAAGFLLLNLATALTTGAPGGVFAGCLFLLPLAMLVLLVVWLFPAMSASGQADAARYAAQYWQQQAYVQPGYPYPQQAPPMPPPLQAPPHQPPPPERGGPPDEEPPYPPGPPR